MVLESVRAKNQPLLEAKNVTRAFGRRNPVHALAGVDLSVHAGQSVGIAGESGSGKSTLLKLMLGLDHPTTGDIAYRGDDIAAMNRQQERAFRRSVQAVFQDPAASFNPRQRIGDIITEPLALARSMSREERRSSAVSMLESIDLPGEFAGRYPHELSGGQKQRVAIARALGPEPDLVLLDEPVTALDISVRGTILNLAKARAIAENVTYVVVSHDLSAIYHLTDVLHVMRRGIVVEAGPTTAIVSQPAHPYTKRLVDAIGDPLAGYRPGQAPAEDAETAEPGMQLGLTQVGEQHFARV